MSSRPAIPNQRDRWFAAIEARAPLVIAAVALVTALLAVPFLTMAPTRSASTEPGGDVFTARDLVAERFASSVRVIGFVVEDPAGDILRAGPLLELQAAEERLRRHPDIGPTLFSFFDAESGREIVGVVSFADLVDAELRSGGVEGLAVATDSEVKAAGGRLIERHGESSTLLGLSTRSTIGPDGTWTVPAVTMPVLADDTVLGFGATSVALGGDTRAEEYDRQVEEVLRSAEGLDVNGIAIGLNLTSQEQGAVAGPFIGFTILAVLVLVGLTFRSYWILAVVSTSFLALIVWLKGISNLIGLEDDLVLSLIVPVAMISFGVDFAFHALGRYREEQAAGGEPARAFALGSAAVVGALVLALTSDSVAFLANLTSGIDSIQQFGIGATIALASAFVLLGIVTPLAVSRIEGSLPAPAPGRRSTLFRLLGGAAAASMAMASVLLMVFVLPWLGVVLAATTVLATLVGPYLVRRRRLNGGTAPNGTAPNGTAPNGTALNSGGRRLGPVLGEIVVRVARRPAIVVGSAVVITGIAASLAVRIPAEFDVEDFFSADTDFVVGLDLIDEHVGERGGEPAQLYVEGDLADPANLIALDRRLDEIRTLATPTLARDDTGEVRINGGIFTVFEAAWASPVMAGIVAEQTGVTLSDVDDDGIPDSREQIAALVATASEIGVPLEADRLILTPNDVTTAVDLVDGPPFGSDRPSATVFELELLNSRTQESVAGAGEQLTVVAEALSDDLGGTFVQATGSPFVREASLEATNRALQVSLPVAIVLCLLVSVVFLRSARYGLASIVPIVMVVAWLYATMYLAGFAINFVTATIAAVSIGIGIDFAIHFIVRYREELDRHGDRQRAVRITGEGTGLALAASALSSAVGFGILALAPMPLFAVYGLLTAVMILMALVATLGVLPSLLILITRDAEPDPNPVLSAEPATEPVAV